ncbi:hypothetical protein [Paenibacillus sp. DCT19]|uniref:hypothetical protein n=1 Tax=Paenibacillus sp. DCT19 TaxID=2211212 RepID=UPI0020C32F3B|nr:hypothetical protein [Paenibacillus sp. DCT19]
MRSIINKVGNSRRLTDRTQFSNPKLLEVIVAAVVYLAFLYGAAPAVARFFSSDIVSMGLALAALSGIMGLAAFAAAYLIRIRRLSVFGIRSVSKRQVLLGIMYGIAAVLLTRVVYIIIYLSGVSLVNVQESYQSASTGGILAFVFQIIFIAVLTPLVRNLHSVVFLPMHSSDSVLG